MGKKRVRFPRGPDLATVVCNIPHHEEFTPEDMENLFFSRSDYQTSRSAAKVISKESERYGFSKNLDDTYNEKCREAQERLNLWVAQGHARRGLERWANRKHGEKRQQDQFQVIMAVLRAQDDMLAEHGQVNDEQLRKVANRATRVSRHFARMMGKADSYAMQNELKQSDDMRSLYSSFSSRSLQSDAMSRKSSIDSSKSARRQHLEVDHNQIVEFPMPRVDELKDSGHVSLKSPRRLVARFSSFRIGRSNNNRDASSKGEQDNSRSRVAAVDDPPRVSRVAA